MLWNTTESKQISQTTNNRTREQQIELEKELEKERDPTVDYPVNNNRGIKFSSLGINYRVFHYIKVFFDKVGGM